MSEMKVVQLGMCGTCRASVRMVLGLRLTKTPFLADIQLFTHQMTRYCRSD